MRACVRERERGAEKETNQILDEAREPLLGLAPHLSIPVGTSPCVSGFRLNCQKNWHTKGSQEKRLVLDFR